jgi:hypothetical protein
MIEFLLSWLCQLWLGFALTVGGDSVEWNGSVQEAGARLQKPKLSEPQLTSERGTNRIMNSKNEQTLTTKGMTGSLILAWWCYRETGLLELTAHRSDPAHHWVHLDRIATMLPSLKPASSRPSGWRWPPSWSHRPPDLGHHAMPGWRPIGTHAATTGSGPGR